MPQSVTDATRRAYWSEQFDAAYRLMFDTVLPYAVSECGEPLVSLQEAAAAADTSPFGSLEDRRRQSMSRLQLAPAGERPLAGGRSGLLPVSRTPRLGVS